MKIINKRKVRKLLDSYKEYIVLLQDEHLELINYCYEANIDYKFEGEYLNPYDQAFKHVLRMIDYQKQRTKYFMPRDKYNTLIDFLIYLKEYVLIKGNVINYIAIHAMMNGWESNKINEGKRYRALIDKYSVI